MIVLGVDSIQIESVQCSACVCIEYSNEKRDPSVESIEESAHR